MLVFTPDWEARLLGRENPFRYYEIKRFYKPSMEIISPSGGDDTRIIQSAIDKVGIAPPEIIRVSIEGKWRWPWEHCSGLKEIDIRPSCFFLTEGEYVLSL